MKTVQYTGLTDHETNPAHNYKFKVKSRFARHTGDSLALRGRRADPT